jgi:hypothetical protein
MVVVENAQRLDDVRTLEQCGGGKKGFGHGPVGMGWLFHNEDAMKGFGVTEKQLGQLREMVYQSEIQQIQGRAGLEIAHRELRRLLDDTKSLEEAVDKAIEKISGLEAQFQKDQGVRAKNGSQAQPTGGLSPDGPAERRIGERTRGGGSTGRERRSKQNGLIIIQNERREKFRRPFLFDIRR